MPNVDSYTVATIGRGLSAGGNYQGLVDASGAQVVMDFFMKAILDGKGFQVRAGTITTPLVGDVLITDTAAEYAVDAVSGQVIIPVFQNISINLATGTVHEYATKSVATVSSSGTAFTPLPLLSGGTAASTTARVAAAGGVTVTAELATTTLRHWSYSNPIAVAANGGISGESLNWEPRTPPVLQGARSLYTQIAAASTGPSYYANLDYLEFTESQLGL